MRNLVNILNHLPTKALTEETSYEVWTCTKPKFDHVHIFICLALVKVSNVYMEKLDARSVTMIYIRKEPRTKAHRLLSQNMGRLYVS